MSSVKNQNYCRCVRRCQTMDAATVLHVRIDCASIEVREWLPIGSMLIFVYGAPAPVLAFAQNSVDGIRDSRTERAMSKNFLSFVARPLGRLNVLGADCGKFPRVPQETLHAARGGSSTRHGETEHPPPKIFKFHGHFLPVNRRSTQALPARHVSQLDFGMLRPPMHPRRPLSLGPRHVPLGSSCMSFTSAVVV